jgi:hypothetical protein
VRILLYLLLITASINVSANEEELLRKFFGKDGIADKQAVYTGEMLENFLGAPTLGEELSTGVEVQYRPLQRTKKSANYAVLLTEKGHSQDWYIYFVYDQGVWKLSAVRTLWLPEFFNMALHELGERTSRTPAEEYHYQNMRLVSSTDAELKTFLIKNISTLDRIAELARLDTSAANDLAKKISIDAVKVDDKSGIVTVILGGILDNAVGYIFVPVGTHPPEMSSENYIYIEQISERWFIYKTT